MKKEFILAFLWIGAVCALCCGCGKKSDMIRIGETQGQAAESASQGEQVPGKASDVSEGADTAEEEEAVIRVYVCGAVMNPGVVEIAAGSRAEDALFAAGGFGEDADREAVNLADWVSDGQKLYFPAEGEEIETVSGEDASSGLVNINTADAAALCTLPGVGESRAADIIAWREANGGFDSCEDIMKVSGIKNAMYEKIRDLITVN